MLRPSTTGGVIANEAGTTVVPPLNRRAIWTTNGRSDALSLGVGGRLLRGYIVLIIASFLIAVASTTMHFVDPSDLIFSVLAGVAVIGCGHPVLVAAGLAEAVVGRPDYMAGQGDGVWDVVFCSGLGVYVVAMFVIAVLKLFRRDRVGLVLLSIAAFYVAMGYWVCLTSES